MRETPCDFARAETAVTAETAETAVGVDRNVVAGSVALLVRMSSLYF